jgi:hypothetical protein
MSELKLDSMLEFSDWRGWEISTDIHIHVVKRLKAGQIQIYTGSRTYLVSIQTTKCL